jgi:hypothetical protein
MNWHTRSSWIKRLLAPRPRRPANVLWRASRSIYEVNLRRRDEASAGAPHKSGYGTRPTIKNFRWGPLAETTRTSMPRWLEASLTKADVTGSLSTFAGARRRSRSPSWRRARPGALTRDHVSLPSKCYLPSAETPQAFQ